MYFISKSNNKMSNLDEKKTDKIIELLEELVLWTKISNFENIRKVLSDILKDDSDKRAYQFSDGRTCREVAKEAGFKSISPILNLWKKLYKLGLVDRKATKGGGFRYTRLFSLEALGIKVPPLQTDKKSGE